MGSTVEVHDEETLQLLDRINLFLAIFNTTYWWIAAEESSVASNELQLIKDMLQYKAVDKAFAEAVRLQLMLHMWYPREEVAAFILTVQWESAGAEEGGMAERLLTFEISDVF